MKNWRKKKTTKTTAHRVIANQENNKMRKILKRIKIKVIENPVNKAIDYYRQQHPENQLQAGLPKDFLMRLTLNYIRHNCSNYDQMIRQIGTALYYKLDLKQQVNKAIVKKYNLESSMAA
ncbi:MAG: hypothetical protein KZQ58_00945 [gamma proteobacterium symbiont of Bathyaustriella thionipta]|nr:hypothetical protein [gamma proteobacterium symbiont of Bathyaustriella thionipta]